MPFQNRALKADKTTSQDLSAGVLSYTTDFGRRFKLESVSISASVVITETVTIKIDSKHGANYDVVLAQYDLMAEQYFVFRPQGELNLQVGDEIKIQCTNANGTGTVYVTVKTSELTQ